MRESALVHTYIYIFIYVYINTYVCVYVCLCVHTYIHIYMFNMWQLACVSLTHALNNDPEQRGSPFLDAMQVNLFALLLHEYKY